MYTYFTISLFDIAPNILHTILFILNGSERLSAVKVRENWLFFKFCSGRIIGGRSYWAGRAAARPLFWPLWAAPISGTPTFEPHVIAAYIGEDSGGGQVGGLNPPTLDH